MTRQVAFSLAKLLLASCSQQDTDTQQIGKTESMAENDLWSVTYDRILKQHGDDLKLNQIPKPQQTVLAVVNSHGILGNGGFQYLF